MSEHSDLAVEKPFDELGQVLCEDLKNESALSRNSRKNCSLCALGRRTKR